MRQESAYVIIRYFIITNYDMTICQIRATTTERKGICQIDTNSPSIITAITFNELETLRIRGSERGVFSLFPLHAMINITFSNSGSST